MKGVIKIAAPVFDEVNKAVLFYESKSPGLGVKLIDDWDLVINAVSLNPNGYQKKYKNFRCALLSRFPYIVVFDLFESEVVIYRFIHVKQHPIKRYKQRKK